MGKFTGVLIASEFANTLIYTENALKGLEPMPELLRRIEDGQVVEYDECPVSFTEINPDRSYA